MPTRTIGLAAWHQSATRPMDTAHQHLDLELNFVLRGRMRYLVGGRVVELLPHQLCLLWGGVPHQMISNLSDPAHSTPTEAIWVTVAITDVLRWNLPDGLIRPLLATGFVADAAPSASDLALLQQWILDLSVPGSEEIVLLEIEARLRRLARALSSESKSTTSLASPSDRGLILVETMARCISERFAEPLSVAEIAASAHLHPNYAMTLFRQQLGTTISGYLTLQRIAHAQRCLLTTETAIAQIALESGFGSLSRFYEAFQRQTGTSPRQFRLRLAGI
jgi:AraC family transcriptional regulator, melibiose operon regulatory protein